MPRFALIALTAGFLFAADDPWARVQELKSRSELRIFKKGSREPLTATFDEANAERILIIAKNEQMAIAKEDIDRIDARPSAKTSSKVVKETNVKRTEPDYTPHPPGAVQVPGESYNTSVGVGSSSKPNFETIYRRQPAAPTK